MLKTTSSMPSSSSAARGSRPSRAPTRRTWSRPSGGPSAAAASCREVAPLELRRRRVLAVADGVAQALDLVTDHADVSQSMSRIALSSSSSADAALESSLPPPSPSPPSPPSEPSSRSRPRAAPWRPPRAARRRCCARAAATSGRASARASPRSRRTRASACPHSRGTRSACARSRPCARPCRRAPSPTHPRRDASGGGPGCRAG